MHKQNFFLTTKECTILLILLFIEFVRGAFFLTLLPTYGMNYLNLSLTTIGLIVSAHYLTETIFKSAAGIFVDSRGTWVVLAGLFISTASIFSLFIFTNPICQVFFAALFGFGLAPLWPTIISLIAPVDAPNRSSRMGAVFTVWLGGMGAGVVAINFVISIGYRWSLFLLFFIFLAAVLLAVFFLPQRTDRSPSMPLKIRKELKRLISNSAVTKILLPGMFLQTMAASLLLPILPVYAINILSLNHNQYALLLISGGFTTLLLLIPMGKLVDKFPLKFVLTAGFGLSAIFLLSLTMTLNITLIFVFASLVGAAYALVLPAWNALLASVIHSDFQATSWGIFGTIEGLGISFGPACGGIIAHYLGPVATIYFSAIILLLMSIFYLICPIQSACKTGGK